MPILPNSRHERFCQGVAAGKSLRKSYLDAGYNCKPSAADGSAAALKRKAEIQDRIAELSDSTPEIPVERAQVSKKWLHDRVQDLARKAEELGNLAVARACYELLGRDYGAFQESKTLTVRSLRDMNSEEIEAMLAELGADAEAKANRGRPN